METDRIEIKTFVVSIIGVILLEVGGRFFSSIYPMLDLLGVVMGLRFLEIITLLMVVSLLGKGMVAVGLTRDLFVSGLMRGLRWSFLFAVITSIGFFFLMGMGINPFQLLYVQLPETHFGLSLFFLTGALIGPVGEELFFRGIVYGFLRQWSIPVAFVLSNIFFVLMHSSGGAVPLPQIIGGIVFTCAYEQRGELMAPVVIHCLGNLSIFLLPLIAQLMKV
jgi:membrane protease YdiL (CAAX protease family)